MNRTLWLFAITALTALAHADTPRREQASHLWKVTHPKAGSATAASIKGSGYALSLPAVRQATKPHMDPKLQQKLKQQGVSVSLSPLTSRWTPAAQIRLQRTLARPAKKGEWKGFEENAKTLRLFARFRDGRVLGATRVGGAISSTREENHFELNLPFPNQRLRDAAAQTRDPENFRPYFWNDVVEFWLLRGKLRTAA